MKYIVKIIVSAFALISAAACYNNEIDNPDNPQNPEQSGLRITATMAKTRVSFGNEDSNNIYPEWEEGDILFGFYGDDPDDNGIVLKVCDVDEGVAELEIVSGNTLGKQETGTDVCLIYTGCNVEDLEGSIDPDDFKFDAEGKFDVDLTSQNLDRIPVCMSATAKIEGTNAAKTLNFSFKYDCAILEIQSLRGFKEDTEVTYASISKIKVTNVLLKGTYTFDDGNGLVFGKTDNTLVLDYSVSADKSDNWYVDENGELVVFSGSPKNDCFLIAVVPNSDEEVIEVNVYKKSDPATPYFTHTCNSTTISAGRCYVVRSDDVVAKTIDGLYFTTVKAAFDRAAEIADELKIDPTLYNGNNIVTLVKDEIEGLGAPASGWRNDGDSPNGEYDVALIIDIDYPVTLDLNGCCLDLGYYSEDFLDTGGFMVKDGGYLKVTDNVGEGEFWSDSDCPMIENSGQVDILNGLFDIWESFVIKNNDNGILNISGGCLCAEHKTAIENIGGKVTIDDGEVYSKDSYAVYSCGQLEINGGEVYTENDYTAIIVDDQNPDSNEAVRFEMNQGVVSATSSGGVDSINEINFSSPAIRLIGNVTGIISGGTIEGADIALEVLFGAECTISGGKIKSTGGSGPAVLCFTDTDDGTQLTVKWPDDYDEKTDTRYEPLISSSATDRAQYSFTPICAYLNNEQDFATIVIQGGYLFSFQDCFFCSLPERLVYSNSGNFYTNKPVISTNGGNTTDRFSLYDDPNDSEDQKMNSTCLMASFDNERVIRNPFDKNVSYLSFPYKIVKKPANAAEGNTDKYTFTPYGW